MKTKFDLLYEKGFSIIINDIPESIESSICYYFDYISQAFCIMPSKVMSSYSKLQIPPPIKVPMRIPKLTQ